MYNSYFLRYVLTGNHLNRTTLMEVQVVPASDKTTKSPVDISPYVPLVFAAIFLMVLGAIAAVMFPSNVRKRPKNGTVNNNPVKQVPCRNCQFFKDNHYLNCAVQPSIVLTKQALNCSDYLPNSSTKESEFSDDHLS